MRDHDGLLELLELERQLRASGRINDPWAVVVGDLVSNQPEVTPRCTQQFNPRPKNACMPGGASEAVLAVIETDPARWWAKAHIHWKLPDRSGKALDWAFLHLRKTGRIEVRHQPGHERFLLYRLKPRPPIETPSQVLKWETQDQQERPSPISEQRFPSPHEGA